MAAQNPSKLAKTSKRHDIDEYAIEIRHIPLEETEEYQRRKQLCFLLLQAAFEEKQEKPKKKLE